MKHKIGDIVFAIVGLSIITCVITGKNEKTTVNIKNIKDKITDTSRKTSESYVINGINADGGIQSYNFLVDDVFDTITDAVVELEIKVKDLLKNN